MELLITVLDVCKSQKLSQVTHLKSFCDKAEPFPAMKVCTGFLALCRLQLNRLAFAFCHLISHISLRFKLFNCSSLSGLGLHHRTSFKSSIHRVAWGRDEFEEVWGVSKYDVTERLRDLTTERCQCVCDTYPERTVEERGRERGKMGERKRNTSGLFLVNFN